MAWINNSMRIYGNRELNCSTCNVIIMSSEWHRHKISSIKLSNSVKLIRFFFFYGKRSRSQWPHVCSILINAIEVMSLHPGEMSTWRLDGHGQTENLHLSSFDPNVPVGFFFFYWDITQVMGNQWKTELWIKLGPVCREDWEAGLQSNNRFLKMFKSLN